MRYDKRLRQLRIENGYSKEKLATILHIDVQRVENWEEGISEPSVRELYQLSALYEVNVDEILENASLYTEMEQAIQLTADNEKEYIVGATGKNNEDSIESMDSDFSKVFNTNVVQEDKRKERGKNSPTIKENALKQLKFWITVLVFTTIISLFGILPMILLKNRFWGFLSFLPVLLLGTWATIKKDINTMLALSFSILFGFICIGI